jgi:hypothetical protein
MFVWEELEEDGGQIWVCGRCCVRAGLGLVSAKRLRWKPVSADEGSSIVVNDEGIDGDLWAARSPAVRTVLRGE